jgi:hypothetical protein
MNKQKFVDKPTKNATLSIVETLPSMEGEQKDNGEFRTAAPFHTDSDSPLSVKESDRLSEFERILSKGLRTFFEIGEALHRIRAEKLFRATHHDFASYCQQRWGIGRTYAWRVIGAAERLKLLPSSENVTRPTTEFEIRPFLKLKPEEFPKAWREAIRRTENGNTTTGAVKEIIAEMSGDSAFHDCRGANSQRKRKKPIPFGQILVLLCEAKKHIKKNDSEQALESLERIESLLYVPNTQ